VSVWRVTGGPPPSAPAPVVPVVEPRVPPMLTGSWFLRDGEDWTLGYGGSTARLRDAKGLTYLARLLANPGRELHVADLASITERPARRTGADDGALTRRADLGDAGEVLDEQAKRAYKERLRDLQEERDEAAAIGDETRAARAEEEIDFLTRELAAAYGLGGRPRRAADTGERMRKAVTNRIRDSLTKIERVHPSLARHLANSVRTGTFCSYLPETPVEWQL
jgi:hypothetical protein